MGMAQTVQRRERHAGRSGGPLPFFGNSVRQPRFAVQIGEDQSIRRGLAGGEAPFMQADLLEHDLYKSVVRQITVTLRLPNSVLPDLMIDVVYPAALDLDSWKIWPRGPQAERNRIVL
jgi:hypothetical protein